MPTWIQPLNPLNCLPFSALAAAVPLAVLLVLMGGLRKSGALSAAWGLASATLLAISVWHFPWRLAFLSMAFGFLYALWPIMWIVFASLWLYNLAVANGSFEQLRRWMANHASGDPHIQAILVAFCFGALLEGTAGFGAPVAVSAFLLLGLGFSARKAVTVSLIANTAPVAFGGLGIPIVALAAVTGLDQMKLSAMVGRQLPFLSLMLPSYLVWVIGGRKGLRETWPAALVGGASFALAQFLSSNYWGPYATDIVAALFSSACLVLLLRVWKPGDSQRPRSLTRDTEGCAGSCWRRPFHPRWRGRTKPPAGRQAAGRLGALAHTRGSDGRMVLLQAVSNCSTQYSHTPPSQCGLYCPVPQTLCGGVPVSTLGSGHRRPDCHCPNGPGFSE